MFDPVEHADQLKYLFVFPHATKPRLDAGRAF